MDLNTKIEYVLGLHLIPSQKIALIALIHAGRPITTSELNSINNCSKTFENYKKLYEDFINSGLVSLQPMKDFKGVTRTHFVLDNDVLESLIEEI